MNHSISADRTKLTITLEETDRNRLDELPDDNSLGNIHTDAALWDFLEPLISNSELDWVRPEETGDLTDAPMLGIYGVSDESRSNGGPGPISERWAWMDYQTRSLLQELRDKGTAVLVGGGV